MEKRKTSDLRVFLLFAFMAVLFLLLSIEMPADYAQLRETTGRFETMETVSSPLGARSSYMILQDGSRFYLADESAEALSGWNVRKGSIVRILAKDRGAHAPQAYEIWWKNRNWRLISYAETAAVMKRNQRIHICVWGSLAVAFCAVYFVRKRQAHRMRVNYENEET